MKLRLLLAATLGSLLQGCAPSNLEVIVVLSHSSCHGLNPGVREVAFDDLPEIRGMQILAVDEVGGEAAKSVGGDAAQSVGGDAAQSVGGEAAKSVGGDAAQPVGGDAAQSVGGEAAQPVGGDVRLVAVALSPTGKSVRPTLDHASLERGSLVLQVSTVPHPTDGRTALETAVPCLVVATGLLDVPVVVRDDRGTIGTLAPREPSGQ